MKVGGAEDPSAQPGANASSADGAAALEEAGLSRMERIARRAYEISQTRGTGHGGAVEDWLQAEREIDGE